MLTGIVRATRAHYAALQHRAAPNRVPLWYSVAIGARLNADGSFTPRPDGSHVLTAGCIQVKAPNESRRRAEITKLRNRLQAMYPESTHIECSYVGDVSGCAL
jgi:hypothetical protein